MPSVFSNLLKNISQIFETTSKRKKDKRKTKLKSEDIRKPEDAVDFLRALADRIEAGDFSGPSRDVARAMDGSPKFECDIDLKESVEKEEIKNSVKVKMEWVEALEEDSVQRLKDEDLLRMDEKYLDSLDEDDLLVVSRKMLHALKKSHEMGDKPPKKSKKADIAAVESEQKPVTPAAKTADYASKTSKSDEPKARETSERSSS